MSDVQIIWSAGKENIAPDINYIKITSLDEIPAVLASGKWETIGKTAQQMVQTRHTVEARAKMIKEYYANK